MPDLDYTREKFSAGVMILATHPGRINERLYRAYEEAVRFGRHIDDLEDLELALDIEVFHRWMTEQSRVGNRGSTILAMSEKEAGQAAKEVVDLEARVRVEVEARRFRGHQPLAGSGGGGPGAGLPRPGPSQTGAGRVGGRASVAAPAPARSLGPADGGGEEALPAGRPGRRPSPTSIDLRTGTLDGPSSAVVGRSH
jgi:hypothetical protein